MFTDVQFTEPLVETKKVKNTSLTHFFIKRLHQLIINADGKYIFYERPLDLIKIAGILINIEKTSAVTHYQIADHTGQIRCNHFKDGKNTEDDANIKLGSQVMVWGNLRTEDDGTKVMAGLKIEQINAYHVILHHRLVSIRDAVLYQKLSKGMSLAVAMGNPGRELAASLAQEGMRGFSSNKVLTRVGGVRYQTPLQIKILAMIRACSDTFGVTRQAMQKAAPQASHKELSEALQFLICEGYLYTTITDSQYQMTGR